MITRYCSECKQQYDWERNSQVCPHVGFPRSFTCRIHQRFNCGHEECRTEIVEVVHFGSIEKAQVSDHETAS